MERASLSDLRGCQRTTADFTSNNAALYRDDAACSELFTFYAYNKFDRIVAGAVKFYGFTCINTGDVVLHTSLLCGDTTV